MRRYSIISYSYPRRLLELFIHFLKHSWTLYCFPDGILGNVLYRNRTDTDTDAFQSHDFLALFKVKRSKFCIMGQVINYKDSSNSFSKIPHHVRRYFSSAGLLWLKICEFGTRTLHSAIYAIVDRSYIGDTKDVKRFFGTLYPMRQISC